MRAQNRRNNVRAVLAAAVAGMSGNALADVVGGTGQEFQVNTTGATALLTFTSAQNNRGPYLLGQSTPLVIGGSTYTFSTNAATALLGQGFGIQNLNAIASPPEPTLAADRVVYRYHSTGSINGVKEVARAQGLLNVTPFTIGPNNQLFVMGQAYTGTNSVSNGYGAYAVTSGYNPHISWSDVRADQGFAVAASGSNVAAFNKAPTTAGYGQGRPNTASGFTGNNFQKLTQVESLDDATDSFAAGVDTLNNRIRNEAIAVVPFTISASPGTGLDNVKEDDVKFLQVAGRLQNGANFNFVSRDIGSGTRNQSGNNVNVDPSWASGERDRVATAVTNTTDDDGNAVTIQIGQEQKPTLGLDGSTTAGTTKNVNEHRPSVIARNGDKTSGSTGVRQRVLTSRMSLGTLSAGDVGNRGTLASSTDPLRILAIDFNEQGGEAVGGAVQPTFTNVTEGLYQMWSASQAVTVTVPGGAANAIKGDTSDGTGTGVGRKFLNNITGSIGFGPSTNTAATPFDSVQVAGFIPLSVMATQKVGADGSAQTGRTRSTTVTASGFSEQTLWEALRDTPNALGSVLAWQPAGNHNGNIGAQTYKIWNYDTTGNTADITISFTNRTFLAGDFNGDAVRDLDDVRQLAQAHANTSAYLAANPTITGTLTTNSATLDISATPTAQHFALLAMSDLDGDGNVVAVGGLGTAGGNDRIEGAVARNDARYFLYGAAVDTKSANSATGYAGSLDATTRRQEGVRAGQLRKNEAIAVFNDELKVIGGAATSSAFLPFDVNNDGVENRHDAKAVNGLVGKSYRNFDDTLGTPADLVAHELTDSPSGAITHVRALETGDLYGTGRPNLTANGGENFSVDVQTSDTKRIIDHLVAGGKFIPGDADFSGDVDNVDVSIVVAAFNTSVGSYGGGDFNFDGLVDNVDVSTLVANFFTTPIPGALPGEALSGENYAALSALGYAEVPEPSALGLMALGGLAALRRRRKA